VVTRQLIDEVRESNASRPSVWGLLSRDRGKQIERQRYLVDVREAPVPESRARLQRRGLSRQRGKSDLRLDDGAPAMEARLLPSASLNESIRVYSAAERALLQFPEVANIVTKRSRGSRNRPCRRGRRRWVRSDIAIKLFGNDLETLRRTAERIAQVVGRVAGAQE
jgi:hypothetical protein